MKCGHRSHTQVVFGPETPQENGLGDIQDGFSLGFLLAFKSDYQGIAETLILALVCVVCDSGCPKVYPWNF